MAIPYNRNRKDQKEEYPQISFWHLIGTIAFFLICLVVFWNG